MVEEKRQIIEYVAAVAELLAIRQTLAWHDRRQPQPLHAPSQLNELVQCRSDFLPQYQNDGYAARYRAFIARIEQAEAHAIAGSCQLTRVVAQPLFKLMADKNEYEVARLHSAPDFLAEIASQFEGDYRISFHLAPPLLSRRDAQGQPIKRRFGPALLPLLRLLARGRGLRGRWLDPFGWQAERGQERSLIDDYQRQIEALLPRLDGSRLQLACEIARLPEHISGYGHVKARHLAAARQRSQHLMQAYQQSPTASAPALNAAAGLTAAA
jgi:indolepyruvate ferredoxin oxidoreductase